MKKPPKPQELFPRIIWLKIYVGARTCGFLAVSDGGWDFGFCRIGLAASAVGLNPLKPVRHWLNPWSGEALGGFLKEAPNPQELFLRIIWLKIYVGARTCGFLAVSDGGWDFGFCRIGLAASAVGFESGLYPCGIGSPSPGEEDHLKRRRRVSDG